MYRILEFYIMEEQDLRDEYFDRQQALFDRAKPKLVAEHLGEFVAFEDGEILDYDFNEIELLQRVYAKYGYRDLLIKQILEVEPILSVNSISHRVGVD
jgi:uncharacterized protein (UPF0276 family)